MESLLGNLGSRLGSHQFIVSRGLWIVVAVSLCRGQTFGHQDFTNVVALSNRDGTELALFRVLSHRNVSFVIDAHFDLFPDTEQTESFLALVRIILIRSLHTLISNSRSANAGKRDLFQRRFRVVGLSRGQNGQSVARDDFNDSSDNFRIAVELLRCVILPHLEVGAFGAILSNAQGWYIWCFNQTHAPFRHFGESILEQFDGNASLGMMDGTDGTNTRLIGSVQRNGQFSLQQTEFDKLARFFAMRFGSRGWVDAGIAKARARDATQ
mmetsp:Transcript_15013/g.24829  ORF Transcript_15013/g.24829 Transcript_15013/m.24829 type:complete len:268 (-) Transcript_15013:147-950(-)